MAFKPPVGAIRAYIVYRQSTEELTWNSPQIKYMAQYTLFDHSDVELDKHWEHVLLSMVGENIDENVIGIRLLDRSKKKEVTHVEHRVEFLCSKKTEAVRDFISTVAGDTFKEKEK